MSLIPKEKEGRQCWGKRRRSLIDLRKRLILKILPINGMSADTFFSRTKMPVGLYHWRLVSD